MALSPRLEEDLRHDVFRDGRVAGASPGEFVDEIGVTVEDASERVVVAVRGEWPVNGVAGHGTKFGSSTLLHTCSCPLNAMSSIVFSMFLKPPFKVRRRVLIPTRSRIGGLSSDRQAHERTGRPS